MTTDTKWHPISNTVIPKSKVSNDVAWRPVSHGDSPKGVFNFFKASKSN